MPDLNLTIPGGNASVTDAAITYPFVGSYPTGTTLDGLPYVVAPNGIKLTEPTPVSLTDTGRYKNGQQINPQRGSGLVQALDNGADQAYSAALTADLSRVLRPGDVMLKAKSTAALTNLGREGMLEQVSALYVVSASPNPMAMAPVVWPSADAANRPWRTVDLDGFLALLPSLSTTGQTTVPWSTVGGYFNRFDIGSALSSSDGPGGYEYITTFGISDKTGPISAYGRYANRVIGAAVTGMMSSAWSSADKTAAAIRLLQRGCQLGEAAVKSGIIIPGNGGGHQYGQYSACLAWLRATGRTDQYATWLPSVGGNVYDQHYYITSDMIANDFVYHTDPLKPYPYRGRQVLSVTGGGLTVVVEGYLPASGDLTEDTASNGFLHGLNLRRNSDNAQAYITASFQTGPAPGSWTLTLSAPIAGLTAGDMVNCVAPFTLTAGDAEYQLRNIKNLRNPSKFADYRGLNFNAPHHLFVHAIGMHGATMNASRDYTIRAMAANTPTAQDDYPSHADTTAFSGGGNDWAQTFWNAHSATILAMPQIV